MLHDVLGAWFLWYAWLSHLVTEPAWLGNTCAAHRIKWAHSQDQSSSALYWSDATIYLGHYLQVLATEHKVLSKAGQSTEATESEIYYALLSIQRLDEECEDDSQLFSFKFYNYKIYSMSHN